MVVTATKLQNNLGQFLKKSQEEDIVITKKGKPVARLISDNRAMAFLSDELVGLVSGVNEEKIKDERFNKQ